MSEISVNDVSLYYEEHGAGEPIVCIHGNGSSAVMWADAVAELATHGRTVLNDRRSSHRSERPEPYVTHVHQQADDAAALIDALDATPAIVIGRNYGGEIAIDLALRYPDHVRALALLGGGGFALSEALTDWAADAEERVFRRGRCRHEHGRRDPLRSVLGDAGWEGLPEPARRYLRPTDRRSSPSSLPAARRRHGRAPRDRQADAARRRQRLSAGLRGGDEPTAAALPSAQVKWIGGGHLINPAHPAVVAFVGEVLALKDAA